MLLLASKQSTLQKRFTLQFDPLRIDLIQLKYSQYEAVTAAGAVDREFVYIASISIQFNPIQIQIAVYLILPNVIRARRLRKEVGLVFPRELHISHGPCIREDVLWPEQMGIGNLQPKPPRISL